MSITTLEQPEAERASPNGGGASTAGTVRQQSVELGRKSRRKDGLEPEFSMQDVPPMGSRQGSKIPVRVPKGGGPNMPEGAPNNREPDSQRRTTPAMPGSFGRQQSRSTPSASEGRDLDIDAWRQGTATAPPALGTPGIVKDEPVSAMPVRGLHTSTPRRHGSRESAPCEAYIVTTMPSMMASGVYVEDRELEAEDPLLRHRGEQMRQAYERVAELERSYLDTVSESRSRHNDNMRQAYEIAEAMDKTYGIQTNSGEGIDELAALIYNAGWRGKEAAVAPNVESGQTATGRMTSEARVEELVNEAPSVYATPQMPVDGQLHVPEWRRKDVPPHMGQMQGHGQRSHTTR
ncbi:hypothetical protein K488DRAFT_74937 [Vararia minispora EC-137]|uniref:Uncharacterized protein n=1 Tax=Vararia minispora EC-137 TaxID=1314806 RepID=A0ACB8Q5D5_9AGAM|nr:hypothetical protein K488DRAFT_74937 [Vararia minispora EC-137]